MLEAASEGGVAELLDLLLVELEIFVAVDANPAFVRAPVVEVVRSAAEDLRCRSHLEERSGVHRLARHGGAKTPQCGGTGPDA